MLVLHAKKDGSEANLLTIQVKGMENLRKAPTRKTDWFLSIAHKICLQYCITESTIGSEANKSKSHFSCRPIKRKLQINDGNERDVSKKKNKTMSVVSSKEF